MNLQTWLLSEMDNDRSILITDGGVSTHLEEKLRRKNEAFEHRSLWSSSLLLTTEGRKTIQEGHDDWLSAGSDIVTTVTYQCHYGVPGRAMVVTKTQMDKMIQDGIELAKECVASKFNKLVVASTGCYGAALADGSEYTGSYGDMDRAGLVDFHLQKVHRLMEQQPHGVALETIPNLEECHAIGEMLQSSKLSVLQEKLPERIAVWVSLACQNGSQLNDGSQLWDALEALRTGDTEAKYIHAVGINCCDSIHMPSLLEIVTRHMATRGPRRGIVCYPNSGEEWDAANGCWKEGTGCSSAQELVGRLMNAVYVIESTWEKHAAGTTMPKIILGGCCRTSVHAIQDLRVAVDNWEQTKRRPS